jgi:Right handed beta helix region/Periplasmic copper-binding protein (NosD)
MLNGIGGSVDHPHLMKFKCPSSSACLAPAVSGIFSLLLLAGTPCYSAQSFFSSPEAPFIIAPNESIQRIAISEGSVEAAQAAIDSARQKDSNSVLVLEVGGMLTAGATPLMLPSKSCLRFLSGSGISAKSSSTAHSLISITNAENVSIVSVGTIRATVDGAGKVPVGISVGGSSRIDVDRLLVTRCSGSGIEMTGSDPLALNLAQSVTRCVLNRNGNGLLVDQTAGFVCLDNFFEENTGTALGISSLNSVVAGNMIGGSISGIKNGSDRAVVTRNVFGKNGTALELLSNSVSVLVSENRSLETNQNLLVAGVGNQFFRNEFPGSVNVSSSASNTLLIANSKFTTDTTNTNVGYFNPPTFSHPHTNAVIIPGKYRVDITIPGGKVTKEKDKSIAAVPTDIAYVQSEIGKVSSANPQAVLVLHLQGEYISKSKDGLQLPPNTCVILDGTIISDLGLPVDLPWVRGETISQVVLMASKGFSSFSGGKIDGGRQALYDVNASSNAPSIALLEGVNMADSSRDGIYIKGRSSPGPLYIYQCNIYGNGSRCIWPHVCSPVHSIANTCTGSHMDGIDLDAGAKDCTALFNICTGNRRHGLFLEEATHNNIAFGNIFSANGGSGVHIWNEEVKGNTGSNAVVSNICQANRKGVSAGGRSDDKTASGNLIFNNVCSGNRVDGIASGNSRATNNYFGQCVNYGNVGLDIQTSDSAAAYFFNAVNPEPSAR